MLRSKSAHRCKSNPRTDQCDSKNSASAHSRITAPAIACPHLRKKKVSLFIKFKPSDTTDTQASIAANVDAENAATTAQTPSQFPSEAGTITRGASISHGPSVKIKNNVQKLALSDNPPIFFAPTSDSQQCILPRPDIETRNPKKKYTAANARNAHFIMSSRTASRKEASPTPAPNAIPKPPTATDESKCPMPQATANARIFGSPHPCDFPIATNGR